MTSNHRINAFSILYELGEYIQSELFKYSKIDDEERLVSTALYYGVEIDESAHIFYPNQSDWPTKSFESKIHGIITELFRLNDYAQLCWVIDTQINHLVISRCSPRNNDEVFEIMCKIYAYLINEFIKSQGTRFHYHLGQA